jgi:hypothetical protein
LAHEIVANKMSRVDLSVFICYSAFGVSEYNKVMSEY